jgi:hypothetical protein
VTTVAVLNITYEGRSADVLHAVDDRISDAEVVRVAVEVVRSGELGTFRDRSVNQQTFRHFVVDRLRDPAGKLRIYLRPKVPFGCR